MRQDHNSICQEKRMNLPAIAQQKNGQSPFVSLFCYAVIISRINSSSFHLQSIHSVDILTDKKLEVNEGFLNLRKCDKIGRNAKGSDPFVRGC